MSCIPCSGHWSQTSNPEYNASEERSPSAERDACWVFRDQKRSMIPLYRLFSPKVTNHFFTTSIPEKDKAGYGIADYVYRLWSPGASDHLNTIDTVERDNAVHYLGYRDEGVAAYLLTL
ncbi:hypothetical protein AX17_003947 [Amanita inopinata Kibby_2008]|nr:hypothetical protein AX17_003947 [Amanita inopinata Kibby_2008]